MTPLLGAAFVGGAAAIVFFVVARVATRPSRGLGKQLDTYQIATPAKETDAKRGVVTVPFLRSLSDLLSTAAKKRGFAAAVELRIKRAGLKLTTGELIVIVVVGGVLFAVLGAAAAGIMGFFVALVLAGLAPGAILNFLGARRRREFDAQLPDVLKLLSASLKAGFSLLQGLDSLIGHVGDPMGSELRQAFAATRLGVSVEEALKATAERVGSRDFEWIVMAIQIQREVGGNLAEILDSVTETMVARVHLRREVRTLTAEGRISAIVLVILPIALGLMVYLSNRSYIDTLFTTGAGHLALLVGVVLEVLGGIWLYRTVQIEI